MRCRFQDSIKHTRQYHSRNFVVSMTHNCRNFIRLVTEIFELMLRERFQDLLNDQEMKIEETRSRSKQLKLRFLQKIVVKNALDNPMLVCLIRAMENDTILGRYWWNVVIGRQVGRYCQVGRYKLAGRQVDIGRQVGLYWQVCMYVGRQVLVGRSWQVVYGRQQ